MSTVVGEDVTGNGGSGTSNLNPPPVPPQTLQPPEDTIESLQKEIENLKKRISEERLKLCDKSIIQVGN